MGKKLIFQLKRSLGSMERMVPESAQSMKIQLTNLHMNYV